MNWLFRFNENAYRHGFWAQARSAKTLRQHPRNCRNEQQLPLITVNPPRRC